MVAFGSITSNTGGWEGGTITVVCGSVAGNSGGWEAGTVTVAHPAPARITTSNAVLKRLPLPPTHEIAQRRPGVELRGPVSLEFEIIDAGVSDAAPKSHT